jgi:hypothetical protein
VLWTTTQFGEDVDAGQAGHHDVEDDTIRRLGVNSGQRLVSVGGFAHVIAVEFKQVAHK